MEKEFVEYEIALELKELGFDEPCLASWNFYTNELNYNSQPSIFSSKDVIQLTTFSQAFRWFREKHNLHGCVDLHVSNPAYWYIRVDNIIENDYLYHSEDENIQYRAYEEAELECLKKLIEIIKSR